MKYLKQRRINKLKIEIAGLTERVRLLYEVTRHEHTSFDRDKLLSKSQKLHELREKLIILSDNSKH